jgi:FkbM family methyltransferase
VTNPAFFDKPTFKQRLLRLIGRSLLPKAEGIVWRLGGHTDRRPRSFETDFHGMIYRGNLNNNVDRHIYFHGAYSPLELEFLKTAATWLKTKRRSVHFLDIGSNVGQHAIFMSKFADTVDAFEPNPDCADQIEANVYRNELKHVRVHRFAIGDQDTTGTLGSGLDGNNGSRSLVWSIDDSRNQEVFVRNGDRVVSNLQLDRVDLIKIDVEGYERHVLSGLSETIKKFRPIILMELMGNNTKGGFESADHLKKHLYEESVLFRLSSDKRRMLEDFCWVDCELVCVPAEIAREFRLY